jgi:glutamine synthetase adenylyltransferase
MIDAVALEQPERAARLWARWRGDGLQAELFDRFAPTLADALQGAPDPDRLLVNFDRWLESLGATLTYYRLFAETPAALKPVLAVLSASDYMADTLLQNPELSEILLDVRLLTRPRTRADLRRDLSRLLRACTTYWMQLDRLRAFKQQEYLRITALDLLGKASLSATTRALSDLADVCADAALEASHRELAAQQGVTGEHGFCILAMGKWGGRELNYSSDIDPIFLYRDAPRLAGAKDPTQYLLKLAEMVVKALSEPMRRGIVFRVDMRLRPEGRLGALARSVSSALHYYETWAEPWERQAMLKARPCAGDLQVGEQFLERLQPWLYRPSLSETDFAEIVRLRERAEAQARARNAYETDLKNGWGGIRDIEFSVQALQLMLGGTAAAPAHTRHAGRPAAPQARPYPRPRRGARPAGRLRLPAHRRTPPATAVRASDAPAADRPQSAHPPCQTDGFRRPRCLRASAGAPPRRRTRLPRTDTTHLPIERWEFPIDAWDIPIEHWDIPGDAREFPIDAWDIPVGRICFPSPPVPLPLRGRGEPRVPPLSPCGRGGYRG